MYGGVGGAEPRGSPLSRFCASAVVGLRVDRIAPATTCPLSSLCSAAQILQRNIVSGFDVAALLGRFLPRLGPLTSRGRPLFCGTPRWLIREANPTRRAVTLALPLRARPGRSTKLSHYLRWRTHDAQLWLGLVRLFGVGCLLHAAANRGHGGWRGSRGRCGWACPGLWSAAPWARSRPLRATATTGTVGAGYGGAGAEIRV